MTELLLLAPTDGSAWATPRSSIGPRSLTAGWHSSPVTQATVTSDIHEALDVHSDLATEVAFDAHFFVDHVTQSVDFIIGQVTHARIRIDARSRQELLTGTQPDTVDIGQGGFDPLLPWKVDSRNSRHSSNPLHRLATRRLALTLLMPRVDANHAQHSVAADDLAFLTAAGY
jgi:hypothetical protein